ncbi:elongation of very long chain fatty acids protein-like [Daktulosphaira vitifoliae]|uniref:elongation of very long chain fatty acids protein-like n=1 Tax=Daktulosphaira vitifoliae TaxID=58002 RepID=UPI0021A9AAC6|nr:elongation of very long chain fatty acids protein-like [Daktulosphaira vitifoliae]XP_050536844.1 elongation of very long chain fatty acids protein-like [Daktulosphaira vitifoliae]XP_050536845.1 elongation of very long chain fatty acids protein-like [Daktulosphaira vitifoliae]
MWSQISRGYNTLMNDYSDPRVKDWFLMSSPLPTLITCLSYAFIVKVLGPRLMRDRKPFQLRKTLIIYNFLQVIFSAWIFWEAWDAAWGRGYSLRCQPVDYSTSPEAMRVARGCWWYYFSKFTEFFDTFFFVMRKKYDQVSTLHVIHHGVMPMSVWFGVKFTPGGHSTFFGLLNTFVHIIMYTYYMLAAIGPQMQKYLWWKKYLTLLQMVQFIMVFVHASQLLFIDCDYPKAFAWIILLHAVMFYFLFSNFYKQSYKKRDDKAKAAQKKKYAGNTANEIYTKENNVPKQVSGQQKSFWSNISSTPCFLPAVTDGDSSEEIFRGPAYSNPIEGTPQTAFLSGESSMRNRAFVSKLSDSS